MCLSTVTETVMVAELLNNSNCSSGSVTETVKVAKLLNNFNCNRNACNSWVESNKLIGFERVESNRPWVESNRAPSTF